MLECLGRLAMRSARSGCVTALLGVVVCGAAVAPWFGWQPPKLSGLRLSIPDAEAIAKDPETARLEAAARRVEERLGGVLAASAAERTVYARCVTPLKLGMGVLGEVDAQLAEMAQRSESEIPEPEWAKTDHLRLYEGEERLARASVLLTRLKTLNSALGCREDARAPR